MPAESQIKLIILDRDGVINQEQGHITKLSDFVVLEGVYEAIARMNSAGLKVCVASNQSGLARGILTEETLAEIQASFEEKLAGFGGRVDAWFYSPWHPDRDLEGGVTQWLGEHPDRKPSSGMLRKALEFSKCSADEAIMVGDSRKDHLAARDLGVRFIGVRSAKVDELADCEEVYGSLSEVMGSLVLV